jgi:hypothetical protein
MSLIRSEDSMPGLADQKTSLLCDARCGRSRRNGRGAAGGTVRTSMVNAGRDEKLLDGITDERDQRLRFEAGPPAVQDHSVGAAGVLVCRPEKLQPCRFRSELTR